MAHQSDLELLDALRQDSKLAFEGLYQKYWERLYLYAFKLCKDQELSQSIVQDVFVTLWRKRQQADIQTLDNYLFQSIKYQVFKHYRDQTMSREVLEENFDQYLIESSVAEDDEIFDLLQESIDRLPEKRRRILFMNKIQGNSIDEISNELQLSRQTVKNQLSSAIKQLRLDLNP